jgi:hypothetical protein
VLNIHASVRATEDDIVHGSSGAPETVGDFLSLEFVRLFALWNERNCLSALGYSTREEYVGFRIDLCCSAESILPQSAWSRGDHGPQASSTERLYARLLELYPPAFLQQHRAEMLQNFADRRRHSGR